jgi:hypothetical protein
MVLRRAVSDAVHDSDTGAVTVKLLARDRRAQAPGSGGKVTERGRAQSDRLRAVHRRALDPVDFNILLLLFVKDESLEYVIYIINAIMTPIFLGDFLYRFFTAESKSRYFWRNFGWADLLSSLPFPNAKILRLFRLWRVFRLFGSLARATCSDEFISHRAENALLTVVFLVLCVLQFGALAVLRAELRPPTPTSPALRRHLVDLRDHHHGRLWRPLPVTSNRPHHRRAGHDRRRGPVRHPQRFPGQPVPHAAGAERTGRSCRRGAAPTIPRRASPS